MSYADFEDPERFDDELVEEPDPDAKRDWDRDTQAIDMAIAEEEPSHGYWEAGDYG